MRRLVCSITARMYILVPVSVIVSMKSAASSASACERRNCAQVVAARSGAGSIAASQRISQTVDGATFTPSASSSLCSRRYPQLPFSRAKRSTRARIDRRVRGRPRRRGRDRAACRSELRTAEGYLRRVDHPLADPLRSAIRSVLDAPAAPGQPARNRPCPCGSGRKYKVCCQATAVAPLDARAEVLYGLLSTFAQRAVLTEPFGLLINRCGGDLNAALLCIDLLLTHEGALGRFLQARGG